MLRSVKASFDIAIVGSGFAGSLLAMIARRLGRSVVLIEKGRHPRFVIGESSTPLANLLLEELAVQYDLPRLIPLTKWGTWQKSHPEIACGLKRGFTFYHHEFGRPFRPEPDRRNELLVAASPHDRIADTHWYRPDFDHFLMREAQETGADYLDETKLTEASRTPEGFRLAGERHGKAVSIQARFVIDASGPRGFLHHALGLGEATLERHPPTESLYSHFRGVNRFADGLPDPSQPDPPYPPDDAALHHLFDGGWIWVLRFNNGITSAGVAATTPLAKKLRLSEGAAAWRHLLGQLPSVAAQFSGAEAVIPFIHQPRLAFRSSAVAGERWALLPSAAGFIDPLLSTGFPLTLLGVKRLAALIEESWETETFAARLSGYERETSAESLAAERLIAALYSALNNFESFAPLSLLYFAAASFSETARRLGKPALAPSFLLHDHPEFGPRLRDCCDFAVHAAQRGWSGADRAGLRRRVFEALEPLDVAGLADVSRQNWFPARAEDLLNAAPKLGVDRAAIRQLLARCGF
jgi:FADH2 O2-dependent halogenase